MPVPTETILRVVATILWSDGNVMQNVFSSDIVGEAGPYDEVDVVADALAWVVALYNTITTLVSDECDGSQVQVYRWDPAEEDWDEVGSDPWVWDPDNTTDQLPRGVAALLNAKSTDADSSAKKYLGGLTEGPIDDGLWNAGALADFIDFGGEWVQSFVGSVTGATWNPGVWSVKDLVLNPFVATVIIPTIPAYQRRRKRGVGI